MCVLVGHVFENLMLVSTNLASEVHVYLAQWTSDSNTNLEYDNEKKEEVGIATKLVKQEKKDEREHIVLSGADFVGAELFPVPLRVVDIDGPVWLHPL